MDRPLTKRLRASLACNGCRQTKSKCDGGRPMCERCVRNGASCVYSQSGHDKRMQRQDERRANLVLMNRIKELEDRLAAVTTNGTGPDDVDREQPSNSDGSESTADAIATGVFDQPPARDVGYFGSSSNHAFFWSLSASIEAVSRRDARGQDLSRLIPPAPPPLAPERRPTDGLGDDAFPGLKVAVAWSMRFFHTVGAVLPYVDESDVLAHLDAIDGSGRGWQAVDQSTQSLLSIIFAHALNTLDERSPEPFYRRALALMDNKAAHVPTISSLQALLLTGRFQQNTQRSMESWAPHYMSVRVAYQLGIHAPASYKQLGVHDKELRSRLWFAVVNQDRVLTANLARPSLVPQQHVRPEIAEFLDAARPSKSREMNCSRDSISYFCRLISLYEIQGSAVETIYGANINCSSRLAMGDLLAKTMDLVWKLDEWRTRAVLVGDVGQLPATALESRRFSVLLTIFHYRARMLVHGSLLMRVLERVTGSSDQDASSAAVDDASLSLLSNYLRDLRDWLRLIEAILNHDGSFLACNVGWWSSNYMMVSTCIHAFAFWMLTDKMQSSTVGMHSAEAESFLRSSLDMLRRVGGSSIMSRKAHRCLERYLDILKTIRSIRDSSVVSDSVGDQTELQALTPATALAPSAHWTSMTAAATGEGGLATGDVFAAPMDFLGGVGHVDFMYSGFLDIGDFDAAGFN
ncbi:C6 transcription factor [Ophiocordyceps camponoti-floridani]|uniref:C6 transcription factor n=1 Tax=Ophiocordyceps camponoti-floridani TaxID=2030778 RepID=A0A8H4VDT6_9HYPO|nr:C6 transcription factor [Ophiocordyceps camponoti-floridani]